MKQYLWTSILCLGVFAACQKNDKPEFTGFENPTHFPTATYPFNSNPVTEAGFELGRKLFYEGKLSRDGSISCGSCHLQSAAFSHVDHTVSHGIDDKLGTRNAPAVQNMAWSSTFMWDGGVHNLDMFSFSPIENPVEMDEKVANVLLKLQATTTYPPLFKAAFGTQEINSTRMMQALSQFMCMLVSANSRYDQFVQGNNDALNATEKEGLTIFRAKCANCHTEPLFTDNSFRNNGLPIGNDKGRSRITLNPADDYTFKVPSLRNIEKTMPYMHNGSLHSLDAVLDHYQNGIQQTANLDPLLANGLSLTDAEKQQLKAFLLSLTDNDFIREPKFSEF